MVTDNQRSEVAKRLREASTGAYRHVDSLDVIAGAVGVEVAEKFSHEVENETYAALADFIDPTCHVVGTISFDWSDGTEYAHKLSCGHTCYTYCPEPTAYCDKCGCRVVTRGEDEVSTDLGKANNYAHRLVYSEWRDA